MVNSLVLARQGEKAKEAKVEPPELLPGLEFVFDLYRQAQKGRKFEQGLPLGIPPSELSVVLRSQGYERGTSHFILLMQLIGAMDDEYGDFMSEQRERRERQNRRPKSGGQVGRGRT